MKNASPLNSDKLRMNGLLLGSILFVASLLVASSVTAIINLVLFAIPVLTLVAIVGLFTAGIPLLMLGIQEGKKPKVQLAPVHDRAVTMSLEGFWQHAHARDQGPAHFSNFQPIDHDVLIHLDSKSDDSPITMREFMQMSSSPQSQPHTVEKSLEGFTVSKRV